MTPANPSYRIFTVGHSGCGKSTFGRLLARHLNMSFVDLDHYIRLRFQATVEQIFARGGEEGFRKVESTLLREAAQRNRVVVACGGGTPCFHDNMNYMNSQGLTIWLQSSEESLADRIEKSHTVRPLYTGLSGEELRAKIKHNLAVRTPYYSQAVWHLLNDNGNTKELARDIANRIMETMQYPMR